MNKRCTNITILGSTGSIGTASLEVVSKLDGFSVFALAARRNSAKLLDQAFRFRPEVVVMTDEKFCPDLKSALQKAGIKLRCGLDGLVEVAASSKTDVVLVALSGSQGIAATLAAIKTKKRVGLATKEILVSFGSVVMAAVKQSGAELLPVDSEHSAIHQCLNGRPSDSIRRILLTASGGPFLHRKNLKTITPAEALKHPVWKMGKKITIDSATLMNKGLEVIETYWLFGIKPQAIEILIHPEGIIHSMVEFIDGSVLAQLALPDMKLPIQYALTFPDRQPSLVGRLDLLQRNRLQFFPPDFKRFPCLTLAYEAAEKGGSYPCVLNAANESAVDRFLTGAIRFPEIPKIIEKTLSAHKGISNPTLEELLAVERWAQQYALEA
jgi:1-deoxy-D-xylulose-5-phosphate reductoisomerase